jgi:hypothetical protein
MKIWELHHCFGRDENDDSEYFMAELSEQPVLCHLAGTFADRLWWLVNPLLRRVPFGRGNRLNDDDTVSLGWQIRYEIWSSYVAPRWRRQVIEGVRVKDRNPETWDLPGGGAPS